MATDNQHGNFNQAGTGNRQIIHSNHGNMVVNNVGGSVRQVSFGGARTINVGGKDFQGSVVEQRDGRTYVDGRDVTDELTPGAGAGPELVIIVQGNVGNIDARGCGEITVSGDAGEVKSAGGDITVGGGVNGNVQSSGGNIKCGAVMGSVKSSGGNIRHVKQEEPAGQAGGKGFFKRVFGQ